MVSLKLNAVNLSRIHAENEDQKLKNKARKTKQVLFPPREGDQGGGACNHLKINCLRSSSPCTPSRGGQRFLGFTTLLPVTPFSCFFA